MGFLGDADLSDSHAVDRLYRSAAMLTPGAPVLDREEAMRVLRALRDALRPSAAGPAATGSTNPVTAGPEINQRGG